MAEVWPPWLWPPFQWPEQQDPWANRHTRIYVNRLSDLPHVYIYTISREHHGQIIPIRGAIAREFAGPMTAVEAGELYQELTHPDRRLERDEAHRIAMNIADRNSWGEAPNWRPRRGAPFRTGIAQTPRHPVQQYLPGYFSHRGFLLGGDWVANHPELWL